MNAATLTEATLALLLELAVYAAVGHWGWTRGTRLPLRLALALGAVAVLAETWGLFGAPTATYPLHGTARLLLELGWYGTGALALVTARRRRTALRR
ncbi:YrdB family protein [Kitasatospora sp. NPDC094028]